MDDTVNPAESAVNPTDDPANLAESAVNPTDDPANLAESAVNPTDDPVNSANDAVNLAKDAINLALNGGCIVYPTSTQPALGCLPTSAALDSLYAIKQRPSHMPVSIGVADLEQAATLVELTPDIPTILNAFPEGSLTLILPAKEALDARLGSEKIAIRVVAHPTAKALLRACGPLTATSANISGTQPAATCEAAAETLREAGHEVGLVDGETPGGLPSTLIAWHSVCDLPERASIEVLREGLIAENEVLTWWKNQTSNNGETPDM